MKKIKDFFKPENLQNLKHLLPGIIRGVMLFLIFFVLLIFFLVEKICLVLEKIPLLGVIFKKVFDFIGKKISPATDLLIKKMESVRKSEVSSFYLIELAYKNMMMKKARSFITILGMSVGVGVIVFLLSLGYGIEKLVINRVASLKELTMIDVASGDNTTLKLNDTVLKKIRLIKGVKRALPIISLVGRVEYNQAKTDVMIYAVPQDFGNVMTSKITTGSFFKEISATNNRSQQKDDLGQVAGAETKLVEATMGAKVTSEQVTFNVNPETSVTVWKDCRIADNSILGYSTRLEGGYQGVEYWGGDYYPFTQNGRLGYDKFNSVYLGKWIKTKMPLLQKKADGTFIPLLDDFGRQLWSDGCIEEKDITIVDRFEVGQVLGIATDSADTDVLAASDSASTSLAIDTSTVISSDSSGLELVAFQASDSAKTQTKILDFKPKNSTDAIVSTGFLNLLGIPVKKAIGVKFGTSFVIVQSLMPEINGKAMTASTQYTIKGVIDDPDATYFYVSFNDIYQIGLKNFSQFKVVLSDPKAMASVRKLIETMGFRTTSTVDTVVQIESLFSNLRLILAILGLVALGVASLGMFNTLTVSLLERTRETGGMKAIGMVSDEVQDLFLAEAMIMGLSGGFGGLFIGWLGGQILSILVSVIALTHGQGIMQLTYLPPYFVAFIIICAFIVGLLTGLYPAHRAKKTSALNALRYE